MRPETEPLLEVSINGNDIQPVIQRHQNADDGPVAKQVAQHHLEITKSDFTHIAGHGNKRNARQGGANHTECHEVPGRLPVGGKEGMRIRTA